MITLLIKLLIADDAPEAVRREMTGKICGMAGIVINILLFGGKLAAGLLSGSIAVTADAFNNLSDAAGSVITFLGFRLAAKKPDAEHPYGHGRMEYIAGVLVSALIMAAAFSLVKDSAEKIFRPEQVTFSALTAGILAVSILAKLYMAFYSTRIGKAIDSATVLAAAADSISDCFATAAVLAASVFTHLTGIPVDGVCGVFVGLLVARAGIEAAKETISPLLGQPPEKAFTDRIADITLHFDKRIVGMHDLIVHDYGPGRRFISLHAEVPAHADILEIHDIIDNLEHTLQRELGCKATVHMDPIATDDPRVAALRKQTLSCVRGIDPRLNIHDFRVVFGGSHSNLLFDTLAPMDLALTDPALKNLIRDRVRGELGEAYIAITDIDRSCC